MRACIHIPSGIWEASSNHFSTIGLIGMNEVGLNANWLGAGSEPSQDAGIYQRGAEPYEGASRPNTRSSTATCTIWKRLRRESTTYRLAKHDREAVGRISRQPAKRADTPYYTNSSHLPVDYTADIFDALDIQDELQTLYTSGTVFHAFLGEKLPDWKAAANLVRKIAENYRLPYYTLSPTYSVCKEHGYIAGEHFTCPKCGKKAEVYSRITGYYRPVQNWNDGKTQEYKNRKLYDVDHSCLKKVHSSIVTVSRDDVEIKPMEGVKYLFTTKTCPNCRHGKGNAEG